MDRYWEKEQPRTFKTGRNVVDYYVDAEKLSIARPVWTDDTGKERQGKTVTLDIFALLESDRSTIDAARDIFTSIITAIDDRLEIL